MASMGNRVETLNNKTWFVFLSRIMAYVAAPALVAAYVWMWNTDDSVKSNTRNIEFLEQSVQTYALRPSPVTREELLQIEARNERRFDILIEEIRLLRQETREIRQENRE